MNEKILETGSIIFQNIIMKIIIRSYFIIQNNFFEIISIKAYICLWAEEVALQV